MSDVVDRDSRSARLQSFLDERSDALFSVDEFRERAFGIDEYAVRQAKLRAALQASDVDVMIVTAPDTLAWLHGYRSRWYRHHTSTSLPPAQCTVMHSDDDTLYMIESGYHEDLVRATSVLTDIRPLPNSDLTHEPGLDDYIAFLLDQLGPATQKRRTVGLELWSCLPSPAVSRRVEAALTEAGYRIVDVSLPVRGLRRTKSAAEIALIEKAQAACDAGLLAVHHKVRPGMSELEAWAIYVSASVAAGGEPAALHETVAAGPLMPTLHRLSSREPLRPGRVFHADGASSYLGYHARGTRPYVIGPAPTELFELTEIAAGAHDVVRAVGKVGTPWQDLFRALRAYYVSTGIDGGAAGYELGITVPPADWVNEFVWGIEDPSVAGVIEAGTVTNLESWNAVALVDTVVFEEPGPRILSKVPPELLVIEEGVE